MALRSPTIRATLQKFVLSVLTFDFTELVAFLQKKNASQ
jgi:hypothetical protein